MRPMPINIANIQGPAMSPIIFENPRPCSMNKDAHCPTTTSDAAPQTMSIINKRNSEDEKSSFMGVLFFLSKCLGNGDKINRNILNSGNIAHIIGSSHHASLPAKCRNNVEMIIVPATPQQKKECIKLIAEAF